MTEYDDFHDTCRERIKGLEAELAKAAMEINCAGPVDHRIRVLKDEWSEKIRHLEDTITRLRSCLKRLEWSKYGYACPACGGATTQAHEGMIISGPTYAFGHRPDCWLAAAIKEGE